MLAKTLSAILALFISGLCIADSKTITYCDHGSYPPLSWLQGDELRGVTNDSVKHIFAEQGYELTVYVLESWKRCMLEVELGNIDVAVAFRTPERIKKFAFSEEHLIAENIAIFVNKDRPFTFNNWEDLTGKLVGMVLGYSYGDDFDKFLDDNTRIERVSSNFQNITKLALNRIDLMPFELNSGLLQVQTHGYKDQIVPLPTIATTDYLYLTTAISNQKIINLLPALDRSIKQLKQNGTIDALTEKHRQAYLKLYPGKASNPKPH